MKPNALKVDPDDNVATVFIELQAGDYAILESDEPGEQPLSIVAQERIPYGHKIALQPLRRGDAVVKYGAPIASATTDIEQGMHIHLHNVRSRRMGVES